jgi:hypothetical protein
MVQETDPMIGTTELAEVVVIKASIIPICHADNKYSQPGECVIHNIDTLHKLKRLRNPANANTHAKPIWAQAFVQSNLVMGVCDTDITDVAPVSDKSSS